MLHCSVQVNAASPSTIGIRANHWVDDGAAPETTWTRRQAPISPSRSNTEFGRIAAILISGIVDQFFFPLRTKCQLKMYVRKRVSYRFLIIFKASDATMAACLPPMGNFLLAVAQAFPPPVVYVQLAYSRASAGKHQKLPYANTFDARLRFLMLPMVSWLCSPLFFICLALLFINGEKYWTFALIQRYQKFNIAIISMAL